jgi:hypothetical protein
MNCTFGLYPSSGVSKIEEAEPVSEMLCRYFYKRLCLCVIVCLCVFILVFWPPLRVVVCE